MLDKNTIYSYFQTDDFPTEEQFRATWDSFWHKNESIPMSSINGINDAFQQTATIGQLNAKANIDASNINISAYQNKLGIVNLIETAKQEVKSELLNGAPEAFDTLKEISDWISDDETAEAAILQDLADKLNKDNSNAVYEAVDPSYTKIEIINPTTKKKALVDLPSITLNDTFNTYDDTNVSSDSAIFNYLKTITYDGTNMILQQGNGSINQEHYPLSTFTTWLGATKGTDSNGEYAIIPSTPNGASVIYVEGTYPSTQIKIYVEVETTTDNLKLLVDDSLDPIVGLSGTLVNGLNEFTFDAAGRSDKTIIIRNYSTSQTAKIRKVYISYYSSSTDHFLIPLNITQSANSQVDNSILKKINSFSNIDITNVNSNNSISSGIITMTGSADFNKLLLINYNTLHESSETEWVYQENSASGTFFGFKSQNLFGYNHNVFFCYHTSGTNFGKIEIWKGTALNSGGFSTAQNNNYTVGDMMKMVIKRVGLTYTFKVYNLTKGWKIEHTVTVTPLGTPWVAHNEAKPAIISYAGSINVYYFTMKSLTTTKIDNYIAGDSITFGQASSSESQRFANLINGNNLVSGGGADTTINVKNRLSEIIKVNPKKVLLMIGGNDILFGVAAATYQQNLRDIRNTLVNAGIEVVHCYPTPRAGASTLISFINSEPTFATDLKIDVNTPLMNGNANTLASAYNSGDNLHPNNAGMALIASTINAIL